MRAVVFVILLFAVSQTRNAFCKKHIIPIYWHGPNNQITTFKEALALSYLLRNSITVVPNILEHRFSDGAHHHMLSRELFDLDELRKENASHILLGDLRKSWEGTLDVILYFRDEEFPPVRHMLKSMNLTAPAEAHWLRSPISATRGCSVAQVEELQRLLRPYRYVGMLCYDDFAFKTHKLAGTLLSNCTGNECCRAYKERSVLLRKSPRLFQLAGDFIRNTIGVHARFIAGHIRPMPDECLRMWESPKKELETQDMEVICRTDYMYSRFVTNLQALQQLYNTSTIFIMTHPIIRPRVFRMLQEGGIRPVFIDIDSLNASIAATVPPFQTPLSVSLLAMVEEAVAATATAFLGTAESSMTGMIVQERIARGLRPDTVYYMSGDPACAVEPCGLPYYYLKREPAGPPAFSEPKVR